MGLRRRFWLIWFIATISAGSALFAAMVTHGHQWPYLIGETTSGHYQIELACKSCHIEPFGGDAALQKSCMTCHGEELRLADDSHPAKKFNDPRNADRLEKINAQLCISCHREHRPRQTRRMGVTVPDDVCRLCHSAIGEERPSHKGLAFTTCTDAGCHNFHDNRALYEDFLVKHIGEPANKARPHRKVRMDEADDAAASSLKAASQSTGPLSLHDADAPGDKQTAKILTEWSADAHARKGVNCSDCHKVKAGVDEPKQWVDRPGLASCKSCHAQQVRGFTAGKHGMRLHPEVPALTPMRPELARLPMKAKAGQRELSCNSCHGAHGFNTHRAQIDACLGCHGDDHSRAYRGSPHHKLWLAEQAGRAAKGSGVTCATCHLPRIATTNESGETQIFVDHNQNANLRPNEKMIRPVCSDCHGLQFTLDALADRELIKRNFAGKPATTVESIEWAEKRLEKGD